MFETIPDLPAGVIGFEAVGTIEVTDYDEVIIPALQEAQATGAVRTVIVLGERFQGISHAAMREDAKVALQGGHWVRTALVTDLPWAVHLARVFGILAPGEFRRFPLADRAAAIAWAAG